VVGGVPTTRMLRRKQSRPTRGRADRPPRARLHTLRTSPLLRRAVWRRRRAGSLTCDARLLIEADSLSRQGIDGVGALQTCQHARAVLIWAAVFLAVPWAAKSISGVPLLGAVMTALEKLKIEVRRLSAVRTAQLRPPGARQARTAGGVVMRFYPALMILEP
jgi:hypothetical protein